MSHSGIALVGLLTSAAWADSPITPVGPSLVNADLAEQIADDPERVLPRDDRFAAAVDVHGIYRQIPSNQYGYSFPGLYHSGIWVDLYGEARPFDDLVANMRVTVTNPGSSYGIISETWVVPWPAVTWLPRWREVQGRVRLFDIGRQTLGAGLIVQDQEGSGMSAVLSWRDLRVSRYWFGTNTFNLEGDLFTFGADMWDDAVGLWAFRTMGWQEDMGGSAYTAHTFDSGFTPLAEVAWRLRRPAGMLGLRFERDEGGWLGGGGVVQGRRYADGFADDLVGVIAHDYIAPEQELFDFVRADNIFVYDDDVWVASGRVWFVVRPVPFVHLRADQEYAHLEWGRRDPDLPGHWWFWRYDAIGCVRSPDNICLDLFVSNRMNSSVRAPTERRDEANFPMLFDRFFLGMEGRARF